MAPTVSFTRSSRASLTSLCVLLLLSLNHKLQPAHTPLILLLVRSRVLSLNLDFSPGSHKLHFVLLRQINSLIGSK